MSGCFKNINICGSVVVVVSIVIVIIQWFHQIATVSQTNNRTVLLFVYARVIGWI